MNSEQKNCSFSIENPKIFLYGVFNEDKDLNVESEKISEANRDAVQRKLYQEIIMHLNDATLQMIIAQNNRNGFKI